MLEESSSSEMDHQDLRQHKKSKGKQPRSWWARKCARMSCTRNVACISQRHASASPQSSPNPLPPPLNLSASPRPSPNPLPPPLNLSSPRSSPDPLPPPLNLSASPPVDIKLPSPLVDFQLASASVDFKLASPPVDCKLQSPPVLALPDPTSPSTHSIDDIKIISPPPTKIVQDEDVQILSAPSRATAPDIFNQGPYPGGKVAWERTEIRLKSMISDKESYSHPSNINPPPCPKSVTIAGFDQNWKISHQFIHADGNCQYRAFAWWHFGDQEGHLAVRCKVVSELAKHPKRYDVWTDSGIQNLIKEVRSTGSWGNSATLMAMANAFRVAICSVSISAQGVSAAVFSPMDAEQPVPLYFILLHNLHFEIMYHSSVHICN